MKIIIAGSTGFVATELIRQALVHPSVTSVVALARRETPLPVDVEADTSKFKSVVCSDFENYPDDVKHELQGADACIWTIGVTPSKLKAMPWDETCKICRDFALVGLQTISQLPRSPEQKPLRFIYISGAKAERDPAKKPLVMRKYVLMRGEIEAQLLQYASTSNGTVEVSIAKPGLIDAEGRVGPAKAIALSIMCTLIRLPRVRVEEIAAVLLDQAIHGFVTDTLLNDDLIRTGRRLLSDQ